MSDRQFGRALVQSVVETRELGEMAREYAEIVVDAVNDAGAFERIPIVGSVHAVLKGALSIPDRLFLLKLTRFLAGVGRPSQDELDAWAATLGDDDDRQRFGDRLVTVLDSLNDETKADLLGKLLRGMIVQGPFDRNAYLRMADMVGSAYSSDLEYLILHHSSGAPWEETGPEIEHLITTGFLERPMRSFGNTVMPEVQPELSDMGRRFLEDIAR